jgi:prepilin-type N-terminal cleavage/methylation domain-containing protein
MKLRMSQPRLGAGGRAAGGAVHLGRAGFTVIELVLALALSGIVVLSALSVFWMMVSNDARSAKRFDDQGDLIVTQTVVRRAMGSLIAAKPRDPPPTADSTPAPEDGAVADEALADTSGPEAELVELIADVTGDEGLAAELTSGLSNDRPNFELYFVPAGRYTLPALEVKVMESPVPPPPQYSANPATLGVEQFLPVRGIFETVEEMEGLALQWRPIDPSGPPTVLIRRLLAVEWYALPHKQDWVEIHAAYLQESFPDGVRLLLWTNNGAHVDWFFDIAATTPEGPG